MRPLQGRRRGAKVSRFDSGPAGRACNVKQWGFSGQ
jgi:hypothetical protein